jgi:hypothetical protein
MRSRAPLVVQIAELLMVHLMRSGIYFAAPGVDAAS